MSLLLITWSDVAEVFYTILIGIGWLIYNIVSFSYQIFIAISSARIFTTEQYQSVANNVYIVIGIASLFFIAYGLLQAVINPDNASAKNDKSVGNIVKNIVLSIALIAFIPTIFNFAYTMQDAIIRGNVLERLIFHNSSGSSSTNIAAIGATLANETFITSFVPVDEITGEPLCTSGTVDISGEDSDSGFVDCLNQIQSENGYGLGDIYQITSKNGNFRNYSIFASNIYNNEIRVNWFIMYFVGLFMCYIFVSFCFDMGVRAVKLAYYQIIAPLPILTLIIPGQKKVFENWRKSVISTYAEVFIRLLIVFLVLFLIKTLPSLDDTIWTYSLIDSPSGSVKLFAKLFIILGLLLFMKQAPKLISDMFGIQSGSFKLGIKDKFKEATDFTKVPVIGKAQTAVNNGFNKLKGGVTGALGAGWSSLVNGGSLKGGLKVGATQGLKNGGNQFNQQRQSMYSSMGYKGTAGWLGGQNFIEKLADDTKNKYTDDYKDRVLSNRINEAENYKNPNAPITKYYSDEYNTRVQTHNNEMANLNTKYNAALAELANVEKKYTDDYTKALNNYNVEKDKQIKMAEKEKIDAELSFNSNKSKAIKDLEKEIKENFDLGNFIEVDKLQKRLDTVKNQKFDDSSYINRINKLKNHKFEDSEFYKNIQVSKTKDELAIKNNINALKKQISDKDSELNAKNIELKTHVYNDATGKLEPHIEMVSKIEKEAFDASVKTLRDKDETFARNEKVFKARINEKETEEWLRSEEGQHMTAALGRQFDRMDKDGKFKPSESNDKKS